MEIQKRENKLQKIIIKEIMQEYFKQLGCMNVKGLMRVYNNEF